MQLLRITMFLNLSVCAYLAVAGEPQPHMGFSNRLAEVFFALDDLPTKPFPFAGHTVLVFYITDKEHGFARSIHNWAEQGGSTPDKNSAAKAAQCLGILRTLAQSKDVPESPLVNHFSVR